MTAEQAIERSISHNEIVTLDVDTREEYDALCDALSCPSDDNVEHLTSKGDLHEYWGETDDGDWRVHVLLTSR